MSRRTVDFLGGIVRFEIPSNWIETRDVGATGMYFVDRAGSGTLRLSLLAARPPDGDPERAVALAIADDGYVSFQGDLAMRSHIEESVEDGRGIRTRCYQVMFPVAPDRLRIAIFSYTTEGSGARAEDPLTSNEIAVVEHAIRTASYSRLPDHEHDTQVFDSVNGSDVAWLDERRKRAFHGGPVPGAPEVDGRLELLTRALRASPDAAMTEALGVVFGDALVAATELEWQALVDAYGWTLCLGLPGTSVDVFPIDMLRKRLERGEVVDARDLFCRTIESVERVRLQATTEH